jgi:hypothetical protein
MEYLHECCFIKGLKEAQENIDLMHITIPSSIGGGIMTLMGFLST